jgi:hypothetical protein
VRGYPKIPSKITLGSKELEAEGMKTPPCNNVCIMLLLYEYRRVWLLIQFVETAAEKDGFMMVSSLKLTTPPYPSVSDQRSVDKYFF